MTKFLQLFLGLAVAAGLAGCTFGSPYYTVGQGPGGENTVTIHRTKLGDIKVDLPSLPTSAAPPPGMAKAPPVSSGQDTHKGSRSSGSEKVDYEVQYTHDGRTLTIVSVTVDGVAVPKR